MGPVGEGGRIRSAEWLGRAKKGGGELQGCIIQARVAGSHRARIRALESSLMRMSSPIALGGKLTQPLTPIHPTPGSMGHVPLALLLLRLVAGEGDRLPVWVEEEAGEGELRVASWDQPVHLPQPRPTPPPHTTTLPSLPPALLTQTPPNPPTTPPTPATTSPTPTPTTQRGVAAFTPSVLAQKTHTPLGLGVGTPEGPSEGTGGNGECPDDGEAEEILLAQLMDGYNKQKLPRKTGLGAEVEMHINDISSLKWPPPGDGEGKGEEEKRGCSEMEADFTLDLMYSEMWQDERLAYGRLSLGHCVRNITLDLDYLTKLWSPNTCIVNSKATEIHASPSPNVPLSPPFLLSPCRSHRFRGLPHPLPQRQRLEELPDDGEGGEGVELGESWLSWVAIARRRARSTCGPSPSTTRRAASSSKATPTTASG